MNVVKIDLLEVIKWIMIIIISLAIPGFFPIGLLLSLIVGLVYNGVLLLIGGAGGEFVLIPQLILVICCSISAVSAAVFSLYIAVGEIKEIVASTTAPFRYKYPYSAARIEAETGDIQKRRARKTIKQKSDLRWDYEEEKLKKLQKIIKAYPTAYSKYISDNNVQLYNTTSYNLPKQWHDIERIVSYRFWNIDEVKLHEEEYNNKLLKVRQLYPTAYAFYRFIYDDDVVAMLALHYKNVIELLSTMTAEFLDGILESKIEDISVFVKENLADIGFERWSESDKKLSRLTEIENKYKLALDDYLWTKHGICDIHLKNYESYSKYSLLIFALDHNIIEDVVKRGDDIWSAEEQREQNILEYQIETYEARQSSSQESQQSISEKLAQKVSGKVHGFGKPGNLDIPYKYFYRYIPYYKSHIANDTSLLIWGFKDGKSKEQNTVLSIVESFLRDVFTSEELSQITFVCIPASSQKDNNKRYESFSNTICKNLGMANAFEHITIVQDGTPKRLKMYSMIERKIREVSVDEIFFKNKNVILFDDVVTYGNSMMQWKRKLESCGSKVILAISIGKTDKSV